MIERLRAFRKRVLIAIAAVLAAVAAVVVVGVQLFHPTFGNEASVEELMRTEDERHVAIYLALAAKEEARYNFGRMNDRIFMAEQVHHVLDSEAPLAFAQKLIEYPASPDVLGFDFIADLQSHAGLMKLTIDRMNLMRQENHQTGSLIDEFHDLSSMMFDKLCIRLLQLKGIRYGEFQSYEDVRTYLTELENLGCLL